MTSLIGRLAAGLWLMASACALQPASGQVGKECQQARECDDDTLGCVPVDFDNPGLGHACLPPPEAWTCEGKLYGDTACDCGCASLDVDCANELGASCAANGNQCPAGKDPDATDNAKCI